MNIPFYPMYRITIRVCIFEKTHQKNYLRRSKYQPQLISGFLSEKAVFSRLVTEFNPEICDTTVVVKFSIFTEFLGLFIHFFNKNGIHQGKDLIARNAYRQIMPVI